MWDVGFTFLTKNNMMIILLLLPSDKASLTDSHTSFTHKSSRTIMDKKIVYFGRFFGEKSDFGGAGKDIGMEKSEKKNRRKIADFSDKNRFFLENFFLIFFLTPKICKKLFLTGFEPTQNA